MTKKTVHVAAGVIENEDGCVLVSLRPRHVHQGGLWEFPGGKLESGETVRQALGRELTEELGIRLTRAAPLIQVRHNYGERNVVLDVWKVKGYEGTPQGLEGQPLKWIHPTGMEAAGFPAADQPIIRALLLDDLYLITGENAADPVAFLNQLRQSLERGIRLVQLRAHGLETVAYRRLAREVIDLCRCFTDVKVILNRGIDEIADLPFAGLHLPASALMALSARPLGLDFLIGASCHDQRELQQADSLGLDYALLSPVKTTTSHPSVTPLGWNRFSASVATVNLPVFALGGLGREDLVEAKQCGARGIASIRGLWDPLDY